jgi:hypothetical protein
LSPKTEPAHAKIKSAGNDISPRWANTDAKINSVSPGNGAPSDSNVRIRHAIVLNEGL